MFCQVTLVSVYLLKTEELRRKACWEVSSICSVHCNLGNTGIAPGNNLQSKHTIGILKYKLDLLAFTTIRIILLQRLDSF